MAKILYCIGGPPKRGGQYVNIEHVKSLRAHGISAELLYIPQSPDLMPLELEVPTVTADSSWRPNENDILVIPESWAALIRLANHSKTNFIIHCQNPHYIFHGLNFVGDISQKNLLAIITCSQYCARQLRGYGFTTPIHVVRPHIPEYFRPVADRTMQIAYMPTKRRAECNLVAGIFRSLFPQYRIIPWVKIEGIERTSVARIMQHSAIFASFGFIEGLGLPPLEAMASGCIVAGFHGGGGLEYATELNGFWVNDGDYHGFARQLKAAVDFYHLSDGVQELELNYRDTLKSFTKASFQNNLYSAWHSILSNKPSIYFLN